jgi:hypothetical protein
MIQLKVTWNNADSTLISNGQKDDLIIVAQNNAAAAEDKGRRTNDARFFTLVDDGPVKVTFNLQVDVPTITPSLNTILKVVQRFECKAGVISVHSYDIDIGPVAGIPGTHPLVSMPGAQQASGAAVMVITTDFVDVTIPWFTDILKPGTDGRNVWDHGPHFDANFRVLACLNGTPKLWFASIPNACVKADAVSALVFFRPAGYPYSLTGDDDFSCVFNPDHNDAKGLNFFKIWRFLMEPVCNRSSAAPTPAAGTPASTSFHGSGFFDHMDENANPPAAMERSLKQADKPVVVLFPVVDGGKYGTSTSAQLAEMSRIAVACLHSMGILMRDDSKKTPFRGLKRLGVAGFSFGGTALWKALNSAVAEHQRKGGSPNRIQEIYAFDANGWRGQQANPVDILMTAKQTGDARLRVVVAKSADANLDSFKASTKLTSSAHPDFKAKPDVFNLTKTTSPGGNPDINGWYLHYTKRNFDKLGPKKWFADQGKGKGIPDEGNLDRGARHQFAVFGGEDPKVGETFFGRFLKDSGF